MSSSGPGKLSRNPGGSSDPRPSSPPGALSGSFDMNTKPGLHAAAGKAAHVSFMSASSTTHIDSDMMSIAAPISPTLSYSPAFVRSKPSPPKASSLHHPAPKPRPFNPARSASPPPTFQRPSCSASPAGQYTTYTPGRLTPSASFAPTTSSNLIPSSSPTGPSPPPKRPSPPPESHLHGSFSQQRNGDPSDSFVTTHSQSQMPNETNKSGEQREQRHASPAFLSRSAAEAFEASAQLPKMMRRVASILSHCAFAVQCPALTSTMRLPGAGWRRARARTSEASRGAKVASTP